MPTPQDLLDAIHAINIQSAWNQEITSKERAALDKLNRQKLKTVKQSLRQQQDAIDKQYDARNRGAAETEKRLLLPYKLIDQLISILEASLNDLQHASEFDHQRPDAPHFGEIFYGSHEYAAYQIATSDDLKKIQQEQLQKGKDLKETIKGLISQRDEIRSKLAEEKKITQKRNNIGKLKGCTNVLGLIMAGTIVGIFAALRGFSAGSRPKAISWDGALLFVGAFAVVFVLWIGVSAWMGALTDKVIKPYEETLKDLSILDGLKGCTNVLGLIMAGTIVGIFAALRGFSAGSRPKAISWDGALLFVGAFAVVFVLWIGVSAWMGALTDKVIKPYEETLKDLSILDGRINRNEAAYNQAKKFYDEAKEGLRRIAETRAS